MPFDSAEAARKASFVQFAYNMFGDSTNLTPPADPGIAASGYDLLLHLKAKDFKDEKFYGYLAKSRTNPGDFVLAIRGTENLAEWLLDFAALPVLFTPAPEAGFVALGFLSIFNSFTFVDAAGTESNLNDTITRLNATAPISSLTIAGHSLGGALATLAAADVAIANPSGVRDKLTLWTFGSPRVGLLDFAATCNKVVKTSFRIWNTLDVVPQVPTFPFIHVSGLGDQIVQTEDQLKTLIVTPACEHHIATYQWLLHSAAFPLGVSCDAATSDLLTPHIAAVTPRARGLSADRPQILELGGQTLYLAMRGHR
jgi:hypothetical protein